MPYMPAETLLLLHQSDETRSDFGAGETHIMGQLAGLTTRAYLSRTLLLASASIWAVLGVLARLLIR